MRSRQALQKPRVSKKLPRKGTETLGLLFARETMVSKKLPRKGTETKELPVVPSDLMVSKKLPRKGTETF